MIKFRTVVGLMMALVGLAITIGLGLMLYSDSPLAAHWQIRLGLAGAAAISAAGQLLALAGTALVWRSLKSRT